MRAVNHNDEHVLTPVLLFLLNVSVLISFYLGYELSRALDSGHGGADTRHVLLLFVLVIGLSLVALRFRRRPLLLTSIASHVGLYFYFFG